MDNIITRGISRGEYLISKIKAKKKIKENLDYNEDIIINLREIQEQIDNIQVKYNMTDDNNLIDALIYEEKAMKSKYAYLLSEAKRKGVKSEDLFFNK